MSYSRWNNSCWYCFWAGTDNDVLEEQQLALWYNLDNTIDWTYKDLRRLTAGHTAVDDLMTVYGCTEEQAKEALLYVHEWFKDIEERLRI